MAQWYVNGIPNETRTHSCLLVECFSCFVWVYIEVTQWVKTDKIDTFREREREKLILSVYRQVLQMDYIIIIMSCHKHGYPWASLATFPYRSSPLAGLQGYIPYPHIAAECMFVLVVLLLPCHMWGSIGVHHLWACPCSSSSVLRAWFVWLG